MARFRYQISVLLLVLIILASCSYVTFTDQQEQAGEAEIRAPQFSENEGLETKTTDVRDESGSLDVPEQKTLEMTAAAETISIDDPLCVRISPGSPHFDVTIPDGTRFFPGDTFIKTWRLVNSGTCAWGENFSIVWFSGSDLGLTHRQEIKEVVHPGDSLDISIDMQAPYTPGVFQSNWKLMTPSGAMVGMGPSGDTPFWAQIEVIELYTPTPKPTQTATPTPTIFIEGDFQMFLGDDLNLDTGALRSPGEDLRLELDPSAQFIFTATNGSRITLFGTETPSFSNCMTVEFENGESDGVVIAEGNYYCYRTNQGLPGRLFISAEDYDLKYVRVSFSTWSIP